MYMPIEPNESIKAFMTHGRNKIIESFTQHLLGDSWTHSQSIIIVAPCYAYPKIFTL
jgi:hypothetical protein